MAQTKTKARPVRPVGSRNLAHLGLLPLMDNVAVIDQALEKQQSAQSAERNSVELRGRQDVTSVRPQPDPSRSDSAHLGLPFTKPLGAHVVSAAATSTERDSAGNSQAQEGTVRTFVVGTVAEVAVSLLAEDPFNAREFYSVEEIDEMGQSLVKNGQDTPVAAYERNGRLWVFDGVKRLKSARSAGVGMLRVDIAEEPKSVLDIYLRSRRMNLERSTQSAIDDAIRWKDLLEKEIIPDQKALAQMVEKSESYVSQVLSINRIPRQVLTHMKERPGTTEQLIAYKLSAIFHADRLAEHGEDGLIQMAKQMVDEISSKGLNRAEVDRMIERRFGAPRKRAQSDHQKLKCFGKEGLLKLFPSKGKLEFSVAGLTPDQMTQVQEFLQRLSESTKLVAGAESGAGA